jgi:hypothetical protein
MVGSGFKWLMGHGYINRHWSVKFCIPLQAGWGLQHGEMSLLRLGGLNGSGLEFFLLGKMVGREKNLCIYKFYDFHAFRK